MIPGAGDVVRLGFADGDNVADAPQIIDVTEDVIINQLHIFADGGRQVTVNSSTGNYLAMDGGGAGANSALRLESGAQTDALLNLQVGLSRNSSINQFSSSAELIFAESIFRTPGTSTNSLRINFFFNGNTIRLRDGFQSLDGAHIRNNTGNGGILIIDGGNQETFLASYAAHSSDPVLQLASDFRTGSFEGQTTVASIERVGTDDRTLLIGSSTRGSRILGTDTRIDLIEGQPGQGHLTIQLGGWAAGSGWLNTSADSTVEIVVTDVSLWRTMDWADNPGVGGEGNFVFRPGTG